MRTRIGRRLRRAAGLVGLAFVAASLGCALLPLRGRAIDDCPGALVSTRDIAGEFLIRQRVRVDSGARAFAFELAIQKRGDELLVVGLDPLGAKLFAVTQVGVDTTIDALPAPVLEVPPHNVLRDLHRARFLQAEPVPHHGIATATHGPDRILEIWQDGRLRARRITRDGTPGQVRLAFSTPGPEADGSERVAIENEWCGYRAEIVTLSEGSLPD